MAETTLLVTDSGLGGLSVLAGIAKGYSQSSRYKKVRLIYFNAWPSQYKGYNHYPLMADRAKVFHNALTAMAGFNPDALFIACNTLSVIYPLTEFSEITPIPVTGIVDHGVEIMAQKLDQDPNGVVMIFATPTTIEGNSHKQALMEMGYPPERIITQGCVNLAGKIERDPFGSEVTQMIDQNTKEAVKKSASFNAKIYAGLCCTHFGYCSQSFKQALALHSGSDVEILNPNDRMSHLACKDQDTTGAPDLTIEIYSRVRWEEERIKAYEKLISPISIDTAQALGRYTLDRELFSIDIEK